MGGHLHTPKLPLEGVQLRTPKLSLADAGGGGTPSSDIVTTFAVFLMVQLPKMPERNEVRAEAKESMGQRKIK